MVAVHRIQVAGILSLAVGLLASCSPSQDSPSAPAPDKVRVSVFPYLGYLPFFIAQEEGHFRDHGLDVELIETNSNPVALSLLVQGEIDVYASTLTAGLLNAIARGADIRFVADKGYFGPAEDRYYAVVVRPELAEGDALKDLARTQKLQSSNSPAGSSQYMIDVALGAIGLSLDDVQLRNMPAAMRAEAFASGSLDIYAPAEPWVTRVLESGAGVIWKTGPEILPDFQFAVVVFGPSLVRDRRDVGNRFMLAWLQAVMQYNQGKTDENLRIAAAQTGLDVELLRKMAWPLMRDDGRLEIKGILDFQNWCVEKGFQDRLVPEESICDPAFVEYANAALAEPFPAERSASD